MIRSILLDFDGIFTKDDYTSVIKAFSLSSGLAPIEIKEAIGNYERKYVIKKDSRRFLLELKNQFHYKGPLHEMIDLLNDRGDTGLCEKLDELKKSGFALSILSNQISFRVPFIRKQLDKRFGLEKFLRIYFSCEIELQKPFVGVTHNFSSNRDVSKNNIFPYVAEDMSNLGYSAKECLFIDDSKKNVENALLAGFEAEHIRYKKEKTVYEQIKDVLIKKYKIIL